MISNTLHRFLNGAVIPNTVPEQLQCGRCINHPSVDDTSPVGTID